jgi:Heparinase II/III-like protein/Heparinase II/III N-terminus
LKASRLDWYLKRLRLMSAGEVAWRARDSLYHAAWARRQVRQGTPIRAGLRRSGPAITALLPAGTAEKVPQKAKEALLSTAEAILAGRLTLLGVTRSDLEEPDWFSDPLTGKRAPDAPYAFSIDHRDESVTGNVKQVWELSRMHHLTLLSAAWYLTRDERYAKAVDRQLRSWWDANPFLSGVNWTSGIEIGIRLISFVWIRRLLDGWEHVGALFEDNETAVAQIRWHQQYLAAFESRGSSANNHVIAELVGQLVASCAFDWFPESPRWRSYSKQRLERQIGLNTFRSGLNREQASEYHEFVTNLSLVACAEADAFGDSIHPRTIELIARMLDAEAAVLDASMRPPRQGDGDDGRALVLDADEIPKPDSLLASGAALVGAAAWWPHVDQSVGSVLVGSLFTRREPVKASRFETRPSHFIDAGLTIMRTRPGAEPEVWCRCDAGPHGFLSIAGHAHADALSVEVRHGGVEILADPGTYCYHGEPEFRRYFRSTLAHNTLELDGTDQSLSGGPFMWLRHARSRRVEVRWSAPGWPRSWSAEHDGYEELDPPAMHRRTVDLDDEARRITIEDIVTTQGSHPLRLMFHLGPAVGCHLAGNVVRLHWSDARGEEWSSTVELAGSCRWSAHRGETSPVLGWYSSSFGTLEPTTVLVGERTCEPGVTALRTVLEFSPRRHLATAGAGHAGDRVPR